MQGLGIDPLLRQGADTLLDAVLDLTIDERLGHREIVQVHQFLDELVLGFPLGLELPLGEQGLADGLPQFVHSPVVAQVLGEIVVQLGQFLAPDAFDVRAEAHGFSGELGLTVIVGVPNVEFLLLARAHAAQVFAEAFQGIAATDLERHFILLHSRPVHAAEAFEGQHREIAVLDRPRVLVDELRLLLAQFLDALVNVIVGELRIVIRHGQALVVLELDGRHNFEFGLEAQRLTGLEMYLGEISSDWQR